MTQQSNTEYLKQLFVNNFDCYTMVLREDGGFDDEPAMSVDKFIELLNKRSDGELTTHSRPNNVDVIKVIKAIHEFKKEMMKIEKNEVIADMPHYEINHRLSKIKSMLEGGD